MAKKSSPGKHVVIPVAAIEFHEGQKTLWIHSPLGGTVLRLKTIDGQITTTKCAHSPISHTDIIVKGDIEICLATDVEKVPAKKSKLGPMATVAKKRPKNFARLSSERRWAVDKELGILDWDGTPGT